MVSKIQYFRFSWVKCNQPLREIGMQIERRAYTIPDIHDLGRHELYNRHTDILFDVYLRT